MTIKKLFISFFFLSQVLTASVLQSCAEKGDLIEPEPTPEKLVPITFGGEQAGEGSTVTRANQTLGHDFFIYGYKTLAADNMSEVFKPYTVHYAANSAGSSEENTHNYYYADPEKNQYIKYWDYSASEYRYWGYVYNPNITASGDGRTLTIKGIAKSINEPKAQDSEGNEIDYLISSLNVVKKADFGKVVQLRFVHPYAKVRVMVYSGENLVAGNGTTSGDVIALSNISFGPNDTSKKIVSSGTVEVNYPTSGDAETYTISSPTNQDKFRYKDITLTSDNCTSDKAAPAIPYETEATSATEYYYILPLATGVEPTDFKFSASYNDDTKTAIVPASYMNWKPNYSYTYIFKIFDGTMLFVDAQVIEWVKGGSGSQTWPNW